MKKILIVGMNPHTIDFSQPGFLPGLTADKVDMAIKAERENLKLAGHDSDIHLIDTGVLDMTALAEQLKANQFDGVMVGAGVRLPPCNFTLFEILINTIHAHASNAKIIFNTSPQDTLVAIKRWL